MGRDRSVDHLRLRALLSPERMESYVAAAGGVPEGFALYEWNIEASAAAVSLAAMVEVLLRNALDRQLLEWAHRHGHEDWFAQAPLDRRACADVAKARSRAGRGGRPVTHGRVIAELNLGFWRYAVSRRYLTSLWIPHLRRAFPGLAGLPQETQRRVESDVEQLHFLRNRAAHHEPIFRRDLLSDRDRAVALVGTIDPVAGEWVARRETLGWVARRRPRPVGGGDPG